MLEEVRALLGSKVEDLDITDNNLNVIDFHDQNYHIDIGWVIFAISGNDQLLDAVRAATAQCIIDENISKLTHQLKEWKALLPPKKAKQ